MPYDWINSEKTGTTRELHLWPHRSMPRRGAAAFILCTFALLSAPLFMVLGSVVLWGLLPFLLLTLGGLWFAFERSYHHGRISEVLTLTPDLAHLVRRDPDGSQQDWECNRYWTRANMHQSGGPVPYYVTLSGCGREVEIGAFLSEDERKALYDDLLDALRS